MQQHKLKLILHYTRTFDAFLSADQQTNSYLYAMGTGRGPEPERMLGNSPDMRGDQQQGPIALCLRVGGC